MARILHVTEALGGGVTAALASYCRQAPQHQHYLLAAFRPADDIGQDFSNLMTATATLPRGLSAARQAIQAANTQWQPDWIHLHSSFAGAYGRLCGLPRTKIIYTPHGYAFNSGDFSPVHRFAYALAEIILSGFGARIAAVSPYELACARWLSPLAKVQLLPNAVEVPATLAKTSLTWPSSGRIKVAMAGRILPVKGPDFFSHLAQATALLAPQRYEFHWLGGGDTAAESALRAAGIQVSGWQPRDQILAQLASMHLYCHTAAWEALPMTMLEAATLGLPIAFRSIPALTSLGLAAGAATAAALAAQLAQPATHLPNWEYNRTLLQQNYSPATQAGALATLYAPA